ncbi:hypothetical protein HPB51_003175 [Rhipicephalus microplus]|uniref:PHD-type domain-containing protein n=1 Tax=Rhipicephalus microplus TaxID=6941 RepID=A0A9J6ELF0_RHIMP|nr:hypothetical protein HPB51_003175 [Rhipicephalus microplus]
MLGLMHPQRIKKTHGPDFLENLDSPTMDVTEFFEEDEPHCFVCYLSVPVTSNDYKLLLICRDCNTKAHPACLSYSAELAAAARLATWQCVDCKTCSGCSSSADTDELIICDGCDRGYHMVCHRPKLMQRPQRKWLCRTCCDGTKKTAGVKIKTEVDNSVGLPTPCDSPVPDEELKGFDGENMDLSAYYIALDKYPDVVPDAKDCPTARRRQVSHFANDRTTASRGTAAHAERTDSELPSCCTVVGFLRMKNSSPLKRCRKRAPSVLRAYGTHVRQK